MKNGLPLGTDMEMARLISLSMVLKQRHNYILEALMIVKITQAIREHSNFKKRGRILASIYEVASKFLYYDFSDLEDRIVDLVSNFIL